MRHNYIKLICVILFILPLFSYAEKLTPAFSNIVFFGDSLSDNGNLYDHDFGILPKSPPYFHGRFSNGEIWSDYVAKYYFNHYGINSVNYAVGGQPVIFHNPFNGYLPYTLNMSLYDYLVRSLYSDKSSALYIIWTGGNDYLHSVDDADINDMDQLSTYVMNSLKCTIESLIYNGGKNFIMINLPDFAKTPYGLINKKRELLTAVVLMHNLKLDNTIAEIQHNYKQVHIQSFDLNSMFIDFLAHPDIYNQKYQIHITDVSTSCWHGGYTKTPMIRNQEMIAQQIEADLRMQSRVANAKYTNKFNTLQFANYITFTPDLLEAYTIGEEAGKVIQLCDNPDEHVFWDKIHPTTVTHYVMAQTILDFVNQYFISSSSPH